MKINIAAILTSFDGKPLLKSDDVRGPNNEILQKREEWTYRAIFDQSLSHPDNENKILCFTLGRRLYEGDELEVTIDEAKVLKDAAARMFPSPVVVGQIHELFENASR